MDSTELWVIKDNSLVHAHVVALQANLSTNQKQTTNFGAMEPGTLVEDNMGY